MKLKIKKFLPLFLFGMFLFIFTPGIVSACGLWVGQGYYSDYSTCTSNCWNYCNGQGLGYESWSCDSDGFCDCVHTWNCGSCTYCADVKDNCYWNCSGNSSSCGCSSCSSCGSCQYCSGYGGSCSNYCSGTSASCGCTSCTSCGSCQYCSGTSCANYCSGTSASCGCASCTNCDTSGTGGGRTGDGCVGTTYIDYYCSGTSCTYSSTSNDSRCAPSCSAACTSAGYGNGLCFAGSTTCSAQSYPYSSGSNCFYNCSPKTGTDCTGTCLCFNTDSNKPSCNPYPSGSTCYYNGSTSCVNSGWSACSYSNNCSIGTCCDCASDGCNHPNTAKCPSGQTCNTSCICQAGCTGTLTASISGTGTCTVTTSLTASNCNDQAWQIKDDGTTKCSGTVSGTPYSNTCSSWTVGVGSYTYNLYIGGVLQDNKSITCSATLFGFSISISPTSGSIAQGSPIAATVKAKLESGTTQDVTFTASCAALTGKVDYSFTLDNHCSPTSNPDDCSRTLTITTHSSASPSPTPIGGPYSINICGTGGSNPCFIYSLTVTQPVAGIVAPLVTTGAANSITQTSATLKGTLNSMGNAPSCLVWFEWGITTSYGNIAPVSPIPMTGTGAFSVNISGLTPGTIYYFKAKAKNGGSW